MAEGAQRGGNEDGEMDHSNPTPLPPGTGGTRQDDRGVHGSIAARRGVLGGAGHSMAMETMLPPTYR